jgi:hypothetical protein
MNKESRGYDMTRVTPSVMRRRRRQAKFLRAYRKEGTLGQAAIVSGVSVFTVRHWAEDDPLFAAHYHQEQQVWLGKMEKEAYDRAVNGVETPLVSMGKVVTHVQKKSDALLQFMLQAHDPQKYGRGTRAGVEVSKDKDGNPTIKAYVGVDLEQV